MEDMFNNVVVNNRLYKIDSVMLTGQKLLYRKGN